MISLLGDKVFAGKMPWARHQRPTAVVAFGNYASFAEASVAGHHRCLYRSWRSWRFPRFQFREGFRRIEPQGDTQRIAYDLTTSVWAPGANGTVHCGRATAECR